jgi:hypothetical protein
MRQKFEGDFTKKPVTLPEKLASLDKWGVGGGFVLRIGELSSNVRQ